MAGFTVIAVEWLLLIGGFAAVTVFCCCGIAATLRSEDRRLGWYFLRAMIVWGLVVVFRQDLITVVTTHFPPPPYDPTGLSLVEAVASLVKFHQTFYALCFLTAAAGFFLIVVQNMAWPSWCRPSFEETIKNLLVPKRNVSK